MMNIYFLQTSLPTNAIDCICSSYTIRSLDNYAKEVTFHEPITNSQQTLRVDAIEVTIRSVIAIIGSRYGLVLLLIRSGGAGPQVGG